MTARVVPIGDKVLAVHPPCRVACAGIGIGAGWIKAGQPPRPAPAVAGPPGPWPRAYKVNLGRAPDQDDEPVFALIWNLEA